jgi:hypothetical protein
MWCGYEVKSSIRLLNKAVVANLSIITSAHKDNPVLKKGSPLLGGGMSPWIAMLKPVQQMPLSSAESNFHLARRETAAPEISARKFEAMLDERKGCNRGLNFEVVVLSGRT